MIFREKFGAAKKGSTHRKQRILTDVEEKYRFSNLSHRIRRSKNNKNAGSNNIVSTG
jgi:hypothetical protein